MINLRKIGVAVLILMASVILHGQWSWQGAWSSATAYTANQVVSYLGSSYLCLVGNTNVTPPANPTDWALVAQAGAAGAAGSPATVSIGNTYQGAPFSYPIVTNSGSGAAAVLNFTIPQMWTTGTSFVTSINGTPGAFTFNGGCFSQLGAVVTLTCPFSGITSGTNTGSLLVGSGGSLSPTGTGVVSANEVNGVPLCSGFSPTNGQFIQYTTGGTPNPCYAAGAATGFTSGQNSYGYWEIDPTGKIEQWGTISVIGGGGSFPNGTFTFPTAFTSLSSIQISGSPNSTISGASLSTAGNIPILAFNATSVTAAQWRCDTNQGNTFSNITISWRAVGR